MTVLTIIVAVLAAAGPAVAAFEDMQIFQVIAGVSGNTSVQAIQLRMSSLNQNTLAPARVVVRDAQGLNPIIVRDLTSTPTNHGAGVSVLLGTANLPSFTNPPIAPDVIITNPIPPSYIPAGTLTYESDTGIVYWRLCWGGGSYTGPGSGNTLNDADGNFNPPFAGALPSATAQAAQFRFAATANSTNNANDYLLTAGAAVLTKNNAISATVVALGACCFGTSCELRTQANCTGAGGVYQGDNVPCVPNNPCLVPQGDLALAGFQCVPNYNSPTYDVEVDFEDNLESHGPIDVQVLVNGADAGTVTLTAELAGTGTCNIAGAPPCAGACPDLIIGGKTFSGSCEVPQMGLNLCACTNYRVKTSLGLSLPLSLGDSVTVVLDPNNQYVEHSEANNALTRGDAVPDCNSNGFADGLDLMSSTQGGDLFPIEISDFRSIPDCDTTTDQPVQSQYFVTSEVPNCQPVEDLDVDLQIQHTWVGDLAVTLTSPQGTTVSLMHRVGALNQLPCSSGGQTGPFGNTNDDVFVIFDDQAAQAIEAQLGPINMGQTYRPGGAAGETPHPRSLSAFRGEQSCGPWTLTVRDDAQFDSGFLTHWSLHFRYGGVEVPPVSRDCNFNRTPDECDLAAGTSVDVNRNALPDECEPSCCNPQRHGDWDGDCDIDLLDYSAFQICGGRHSTGGRGASTCFQDGCNFADLDYSASINLVDWNIIVGSNGFLDGPSVALPGCDPNAGGCDAWATGLDAGLPFGGSYTIFGSPTYPPIPADFFGPGSLPFSGVVEWKGQAEDAYNFGSTDTIIEHPPLRFGFGDLPLCDIVPARLESLSLRSRDPIVVDLTAAPGDCNGNGIPDATDIAGGTSVDLNANGVPDECEWYVAVEKSPVPPPDGIIDACKTHANGGLFDATIYVQPLFVFVNKAELDSGTPATSDSVKILDTGVQGLPPIIFEFFDRPFSVCPPDLGIYVTPCSEGNFVPGIDTSGPRGTETTCNSHITPDNSHYFCPPECFTHFCTYPLSGDYGTCLDLFGGACGATATGCPDVDPVYMPGATCAGTDAGSCDQQGYFDFVTGMGDCPAPACTSTITCVATYAGGAGAPITCTNSGVLTGECP